VRVRLQNAAGRLRIRKANTDDLLCLKAGDQVVVSRSDHYYLGTYQGKEVRVKYNDDFDVRISSNIYVIQGARNIDNKANREQMRLGKVWRDKRKRRVAHKTKPTDDGCRDAAETGRESDCG
jgi:hypothetical protein